MKLVAVTRIMNEDDIVEAFVRHDRGQIDHHLFLDNGSVDRTVDILRALQSEGIGLTVLQKPTPFCFTPELAVYRQWRKCGNPTFAQSSDFFVVGGAKLCISLREPLQVARTLPPASLRRTLADIGRSRTRANRLH